MNRFRFSLAGLLGFVTVAAMAFLALRNASELWGQVMFTATVSILLFAIVLAVYQANSARAFWIAFLVFGWGYLFLVYGTWFDASLDERLGRRLVTTRLLESVHALLQRTEDQEVLLEGAYRRVFEIQVGPSVGHVQAVGHPLFALLFALVGGFAGRWVHGGRKGR